MNMYQKRKETKVNNGESSHKTSINWYPGHMLKTKKQIIDDIKLVDVVIEILDARIPKSSQNPDIKKITAGKKRIILLNKSDLSENIQNKRWIEFFNKQGIIALETNANTGIGTKECIKKINEIVEEDLAKAREKGRIKKTIRVMIVGIPNSGKSSLINKIANKKSAIVGNRPGVTKQKQWVRIANNIELLDTPGVLWPKFESETVALNLSYTGTIKDEVIEKTEIAFHLVRYLYNNYKNNLLQRYKLTEEEIQDIIVEDENETILNIYNLIAKKRGAIFAGGKIDEEKSARMILDDFRSGKLGKITLEKI